MNFLVSRIFQFTDTTVITVRQLTHSDSYNLLIKSASPETALSIIIDGIIDCI